MNVCLSLYSPVPLAVHKKNFNVAYHSALMNGTPRVKMPIFYKITVIKIISKGMNNMGLEMK